MMVGRLGARQVLLAATACAAVMMGPRGAAGAPDVDPSRAPDGDDLSVSVLTFGPGDHPFFKFGHNAILVQPRSADGHRRGGGLVFNFGTFKFDSPALIPNFIRGRFKYWLSVAPQEDTLASYRDDNRSIEEQELDLTPPQRADLFRALRENARPENREYLYDYFRDNCSTRVRDAVDHVVGGALRSAAHTPAAMTLRADALRMTADFLPEYLGLLFGLGVSTDAPVTAWEATFLPERLRDLLAAARVPGPDGAARPLVLSQRTLFAARRPAKPMAPPVWAPVFGVVGVLVGGWLVGLGRLARARPPARVALGMVSGLLGLVAGLLGLLLVLLWTATNHVAAHANANILQCAPWLVLLAGYGVGIARGRAGAIRNAERLLVAAVAASAAGIAAKMLPWTSQHNIEFIALFLPIWTGLLIAIRSQSGALLRRR